MDLFNLSGKTAVVIGGSSVLGSAMAVALGAYGADVGLVGRDGRRLEEPCARIAESGAMTAPFVADATSESDLRRVLAEVIAWTGRVDILFNCAGVNSTTPFFDLAMAEWDAILDANLKSVVLACQVFGKHMIEQAQGGSIVNISSVSAEVPLSKVFTYSASKAALENVTQFLSREFAPYRIRVNAIVPGFFPAVQNRAILSKERTAAILNHTPLARFGDPSELQGVAVWLASELASSFVTGAMIRVDGGFGAMTL